MPVQCPKCGEFYELAKSISHAKFCAGNITPAQVAELDADLDAIFPVVEVVVGGEKVDGELDERIEDAEPGEMVATFDDLDPHDENGEALEDGDTDRE